MKQFLIYLTLLLSISFYTPLFGQKKNKKNEQLKTEAKEDVIRPPKGEEKLSYKAKFYEALRLKTVGDYNASVALFEECLKENPTDDAVLFVLAEFYAGNRMFSKALSHSSKAYQIDPGNVWYLELLAYVQQNSGLYDEAEKSFKKLVEKDPFNVDWLYYYSESQLYNSNIKGAIETYDKLLEEVGPVPDLVQRQVELLLDQGEKKRAEDLLKRLILENPEESGFTGMLLDYYQQNQMKEEAKNLLEELMLKYPDNPHIHLGIAEYYNTIGNKEKTYFHLKKAFENPRLDLDAKVRILIDIHDSQSKIDAEAFDLINILVDVHGKEAKTYAIQGDFYLKSEQEDNALVAFLNALELDKTRYPIWHETLVLAYRLGNYTVLYKEGKRAIEFFPAVANVYLFAGLGALHTGKPDEAAEYFAMGKDFVVKDKLLTAEFNFQLAESYMTMKRYAEAQTFYQEAFTLDPSNASYLNNFAYRQAVHGVNLEKALEAIKKADEISPNSATFLDTYAWVYFKLENYDQALLYIERAFRQNPKSANIAEHYGDILFKSGREARALELWLTSRQLGNLDELLQKKIDTKLYHERKP
jgi:tetratricopeptide (TPR) repeat protein